MPPLPDFALECHFSEWEFRARYHLTASDAQSMSLTELMALASADDREAFQSLWLGYTETRGAPDLRAAIAETYDERSGQDIVCFAGAEEGIYATLNTILDRDAHAIVATPAYQSLETLCLSLCDTTGIPLDPAQSWQLDIDRVAAAVRPNTRLVVINFPHNPTGALLSRDRFDALIDLCRARGLYLFSDEAYRPLGPVDTVHLPQVADVYERGVSLGVMSKAYGLPGLRIGWIAAADRGLLARTERFKHYLSICNSGPSERLALIALRSRACIIARNCRIVSDTLALLDAFFAERPDLFEWRRPDAGCVAYPRFLGEEGVELFARRLAEDSGILILPSGLFHSELTPTPQNHFRIGSGRLGLAEGLDAFRRHLAGGP
jgi:aspartate/methionine/tyrosine aminotransferase